MDKPVALITGGGRGIGRATAVELSARGYRVAAVSRNQGELDDTLARCSGGLAIVADVSDASALAGIVAQTRQRFGRIDALINNAGAAPLRAIEALSLDEWRGVIDTNLTAPLFLTQACWPIFREQNAGVVVNVSSEAARDPFEGFAAYGSAKAAVNLLTRALAKEGSAIGIRVHAVAPAAVETAMFRAIPAARDFPTELTLAPADVAKVIADCVCGSLAYSSGETIWLHKKA